MKKFTSKTQKIGEIGENLACKKLLSLGFKILERNYTRKGGEIDIIAKKGNKLYFIEVKSVSREIHKDAQKNTDVPHETRKYYRPEENMTFSKFKKMSRTIELYLLEKNVSHETPWQVDLACAYIDLNRKAGRVEILENIIF